MKKYDKEVDKLDRKRKNAIKNQQSKFDPLRKNKKAYLVNPYKEYTS